MRKYILYPILLITAGLISLVSGYAGAVQGNKIKERNMRKANLEGCVEVKDIRSELSGYGNGEDQVLCRTKEGDVALYTKSFYGDEWTKTTVN